MLSANRDNTVEPLDPPLGCKPGDRVFVEGYEQEKAGGENSVCSISGVDR